MADYRGKKIISYTWSRGFLESLLPHEMAHLIFRDFVGFRGEIPLWLDEGIAQWAESFKRDYVKTLAKQAYKDNLILPLKEMMILDVRKIKADSKVYVTPVITNDNVKGVMFLNGFTGSLFGHEQNGIVWLFRKRTVITVQIMHLNISDKPVIYQISFVNDRIGK